MLVKSIELRDKMVYLLDQTRLPHETVVLQLRAAQEVIEAIRTLQVRGAPAIGVAGAYALVLASQEIDTKDVDQLLARLKEVAQEIGDARPTAVNLTWALRRLLRAIENAATPEAARLALLAEAQAIQEFKDKCQPFGANEWPLW